MKITKRHINAVKKTMDEWFWLEKHPECGKEDYYEKNKKIRKPRNGRVGNDCWLCDVFWHRTAPQIYRHGASPPCKGCPLNTEKLFCYFFISPFRQWEEGHDDEVRSKEARRIAMACKRWLRKHDVD